MSHTQGPWSWWTSNSYKRLTADGKQDGGVLHASESDWPTVVVNEDDARLIAAAPDLLEALQLAGNSAGFQYMTYETRVVIDAAIAKATGEQP